LPAARTIDGGDERGVVSFGHDAVFARVKDKQLPSIMRGELPFIAAAKWACQQGLARALLLHGPHAGEATGRRLYWKFESFSLRHYTVLSSAETFPRFRRHPAWATPLDGLRGLTAHRRFHAD
jgi:hypothetical protein